MELTYDERKELIEMQGLINSGQGWRLEGSYGRALMANIETGLLMLGKTAHRDYWGNYIPSRDEVKSGAPGSFEYVVDQFGEEWAKTLSEVDF